MRWECSICGYIHEGPTPPDECPVCGSAPEDFVLLEERGDEAIAPVTAGDARQVLIIGGGIAGVTAARFAREANGSAEITLLNGEPQPPYHRLNLTRYLAGQVAKAELPLHGDSWYADNGIDLRNGVRAEVLDAVARTVEASDDRAYPFDSLVLANGASCFIPPIPGASLPGVLVLRTLEDAERLLDLAKASRTAIVVGGGLLGLEAAYGLGLAGCQVTVLDTANWLLSRQLDERAGQLFSEMVRERCIEPVAGAATDRIERAGKGLRLTLQDGRSFEADFVLISAGIRCNLALARAAELPVNRGVIVDDRLETDVPDIFAAGDVTEHRDRLYGIWPASLDQGEVAGVNAAGGERTYPGTIPANVLKVLGIDLFSIGEVQDTEADQPIVEEEPGIYRKLVLRNGVPVGGILLGDVYLTAAIRKAIERGEPLSPKPGQSLADLLRGS